jgi:hypothetical protein
MQLSFDVQGIPCIIEVTNVHVTPPWRGAAVDCPSDVDWYGDIDVEYGICDRRGRPAPWLEKKATEYDHQRIREHIFKKCQEE